MSKEDKILLNLASSPVSFAQKSALNMLKSLEKKYPEHCSIKRKIVSYYVKNKMYFDAVVKLIFLVKKHLESQDICKLIVIAFQIDLLYFVFFEIGEIKILKPHIHYQFYRTAILELNKKQPIIDIERSFRGDTTCLIERTNIDYSYKYNSDYNIILCAVQQHNYKLFFDLGTVVFKVNSYHSVIDYLTKTKKIEILYCLSRSSAFFSSYYKEAITTTSKEFFEVIDVILSTHNSSKFLSIVNLLVDKSSKPSTLIANKDKPYTISN